MPFYSARSGPSNADRLVRRLTAMKTIAALAFAAVAFVLAACDKGGKPAPAAAPSASTTAAATAPGASGAPKTGSGW